ncbi:MAG TPA: acetyl-CoA hydrolase/transferase C-terminal domain-containing protein [Caulobacteraceae bacterium]|jgi:acyl-CoA hydrolase
MQNVEIEHALNELRSGLGVYLHGGRAILALPATGRGDASRVVPRLATPTVSLPREDADIVVTCAANLSGADL